MTDFGRPGRRQIGGLRALEPLWVSGLGLLLILAGSQWLPVAGETYEWTQYKLFGTVFPALTLALVYLGRHPAVAPAAQRLRLCLALCFLAVSLHYCFDRLGYNRDVILLTMSGIVVLWLRSWRTWWPRAGPLELAAYTIVLLAASTAALKISWWNPIADWTKPRRLAAFPVLYFVLANIWCLPLVPLSWQRWWQSVKPRALSISTVHLQRLLDAAAALILGLASVRHDLLFDRVAMHHWGFYLGPAQLVRQGGWLLWDVPSQYGFLDILLIACLPVKDLWQSLYLLNSSLLLVSAGLLYWVLRLTGRGLGHTCFAFLVTLCALFMVPGDTPMLAGSHEFPHTGPVRFFWCYVLLTVLVWQYRRHMRGAPNRWLLLLGCGAWLCGTLWSFESAVYCACIWLPAYALLALHEGARRVDPEVPAPRRQAMTQTAVWLLLPPVALSGVLLGIHLIYVQALGHPPDWRCFYEYSVAYANGFGTAAIEPRGVVWALFLLGCATMTTVAYLAPAGRTLQVRAAPATIAAAAAGPPRGWDALPAWSLAVGSWSAVWAVSSYFVGRSYASNVCNICSVLAVAVAALLVLLARPEAGPPEGGPEAAADTAEPAARGAGAAWANYVRLSLIPVYGTFLLIPLANSRPSERQVPRFFDSLRRGYDPHVQRRLPHVPAALQSLFLQARVRPGDAICVIGQVPLEAWSPGPGQSPVDISPEWVPAVPLAILTPLPPARRQEYMTRFTSQIRRGGWLVRPKVFWDTMAFHTTDNWFHDLDWFYDQIQRTHRATRRFENSRWTLIWFEYRGDKAAAAVEP